MSHTFPQLLPTHSFLFYFLFFFLILTWGHACEAGGWGSQCERTMDWLPSIPASTGIGPATQLCALTGNSNLLAHRMTLNYLSHSGQAQHTPSTAPLRLMTFRPDIVLEMGKLNLLQLLDNCIIWRVALEPEGYQLGTLFISLCIMPIFWNKRVRH